MTKSLLARLRFDQELDTFEERLEAYVKQASPTGLVSLINRATQWVERAAERAADGPGADSLRYEGWTHFNNATSAINTAARELRSRI